MKMPTDADIAAALDRKSASEKTSIIWNFICGSAVGINMLSLSAMLGGPSVGSGAGGWIGTAASIGALWAGMDALKSTWSNAMAHNNDVPQQFLDELREKASEISAHRNGKGLWIVRDPTEENLRVMTPAEFKQYEKLVAAQGRGLDKLQVSGNKLTYCRYVSGKLHAPENEPAMVTVDLKTGKVEAKFFTNGVKAFADTEDMKLPFGANAALSSPKEGSIDFEDGKGPVPAHRHTNPDGSVGGWVADTASVAPTAYVGKEARVYGEAWVKDHARVCGEAQVFGEAWVRGDAQVFGNEQVSGEALVRDENIPSGPRM